MRHNVSGRKLNRTAAHRKMLYRNLVTSLFKHERIQTTVPKAKEARIVAEKLITKAKKGDLHSRRLAARKVNEPAVLQKLFEEIGPRYADRPGGYTRIMLLGPRRGDNAELAILELVDGHPKPKITDTLKRRRARKILVAEEKAEELAGFEEHADGGDTDGGDTEVVEDVSAGEENAVQEDGAPGEDAGDENKEKTDD